MNFKFEILFSVNFQHQYFGESSFNGFTVTPSNGSIGVFKNLGLVFKLQTSGFLIGFDTSFAGRQRKREELLNGNTNLSFRLDLTDQNLYNYTANLPENISASIFHFTNDPGNGVMLHQDEFVSKKDIVAADTFKEIYFSKPFGQIDIHLKKEMGDQFTIKFSAKSAYWQYILLSEHLHELYNPAVINKITQEVFRGPFTVSVPGNRKALAFISGNPIELSNTPNRMFYLVENYEPGNDRHKVIIDVLPNPEVNRFSDFDSGDEGLTKKNFSNIIL